MKKERHGRPGGEGAAEVREPRRKPALLALKEDAVSDEEEEGIIREKKGELFAVECREGLPTRGGRKWTPLPVEDLFWDHEGKKLVELFAGEGHSD